jgi:hypothetical protein
MAYVWYVGTGTSSTITSTDWSAVGITGPTTIWNALNGYSIPEADMTSAQIAYLAPYTTKYRTGQTGSVRAGYIPPPTGGTGGGGTGTATSTEVSAIRTLIGGTSTSGIGALTTTDKSSLVAAINEVKATGGGGGGGSGLEIDDAVTSLVKVWSSSKTAAEIAATVTAILNGAPTALNTLDELAAAVNDDANFAATVVTLLGAKAPINNPTFTGTVGGVTKAHVGLGNVDNTSDVNKPVSTAQAAADALKAPLASPTFTGTPVAPTPTAGDSTTKLATTAFVTPAVNAKYTKPAGGIPATDLDNAVQLSLDTADNALSNNEPILHSRQYSSGVWPPRGAVPAGSVVMWSGPAAPPIDGTYALAGVDLYTVTVS